MDGLKIDQSSSIEYHGATLRVGYTLIDNSRLKIQPFISGELNNLVNYIDIPDSTGMRQKGKTHPIIGFGTEGSLRLIKNVMSMGQDIYIIQEKKKISVAIHYFEFEVWLLS